MKRPYFIIILLLGLVIALSVGKAILQNNFSTSGIIVSKAEQEISYYKTQNAILSEQLLTASSLTAIIDKAAKSGFTSKSKLMVIKTSSPLAAKP
jgi:hypothetical protein